MPIPGLLMAAVLIPQPVEFTELPGVCCRTSVTDRADASVPSEGYRLDVTPDGIVVTSSDAAGAFYARQTLRQLAETRDGKTAYPCCRITDRPAYPWRGVLIDEGRNFLGKETVKELLDVMAYHKLNILHWHLTEDMGWRIDIPSMPELARFGSVRACSPKRGAALKTGPNFYYRTEKNTERNGPFSYSRTDLEEVVAYATSRHIEVMPEIDLPGHFRAALAAYPDLACNPEAIVPRMAHDEWGITTNVLCVGNAESLRFLERVMDYVCDVFPSKVIHVGGDECPHVAWERCPKCQALMKREGMTRPAQLQGWITRKVAEYLARKGRRIMGWDEILGAGVPKTSIGQSWRVGANEGVATDYLSASEGVRRGYDMVVTPHTLTYYSRYAGLEDDPYHYVGRGNSLTLEKAYSFDPMAGIDKSGRAHVLGSEACVWGECVWNESVLSWKLWPRGCAMAEILWSDPKPRNFNLFCERVKTHRKRLIKMGVNCQPIEEMPGS